MILKMSELCVVAFAQFAKKSVKIIVNFWILSVKNISHSVTRWLSLYPSLPRMLQMYSVSFILHVRR